MNKKLLFKYVLFYIPMVVGIVFFTLGKVNLISSLLLFCGGYVAIKNTFDYRMVRRNIRSTIICNENKRTYSMDKADGVVPMIKKRSRNTRVRKREKY